MTWRGHNESGRNTQEHSGRLSGSRVPLATAEALQQQTVTQSSFVVNSKNSLVQDTGGDKSQSGQRLARGDIARALHESGFYRESDRFERCGRRLIRLRCQTETRTFALPETCKSRVCPECQQRAAAKMRRGFTKMIGSWRRRPGQAVMLITLTFRSNGGAISGPDIRRGFREVRRLIREFYPKSRGCGAVGVAEIGAHNNLHVHLIVVGGYVAQRELSARWLHITGNSYVVDVRAVRDVTRSVGYVLKYMGKTPDYADPGAYAGLLRALRGTRRLHTFGVWYNGIEREPKQRLECPFCGGVLGFDGETDHWDGQPKYLWWSRKLRDPAVIDSFVWSALSSTVGVSSIESWALPPGFDDGFFPLDTPDPD